MVLLFLALLASIPISGLSPAYLSATIIGLIVLTAIGAAVFAITRGEERAVDIARRAAKAIRVVNPDSTEGALRTLAAQISDLTGDRRELVRHAVWSAAYWLLGAASLWIFLAAYGHSTRVDGLIVAFALANIAATIPLTPGGLGVMEITLVASLVGFGVPPSVALLGVASWRLVNFWLPIPVGAATYLSLRIGLPDRGPSEQIERLTEEARVQAQEVTPWLQRGRPRR